MTLKERMLPSPLGVFFFSSEGTISINEYEDKQLPSPLGVFLFFHDKIDKSYDAYVLPVTVPSWGFSFFHMECSVVDS